ncbi:unnamed protein product [Danaus chrysippus]|uniref:(African queen) hypothetical protein n=1 Tax=Danaus chrysippus TaxID=151541 RepID=A0A8J2VXD8_9NEOP|nr:unnamed protein product [Danaus chrysippus]
MKTDKCEKPSIGLVYLLPSFATLVFNRIVMQTNGSLSAGSLWQLWQPAELARRIIGERPSPVPPTRELWPPQERLNISTLQLAYQHELYQNEELSPRRRCSSLTSRPYVSTTVPIDSDVPVRMCTVGTNTDPPPTILSRIRGLLRRDSHLYTYSPSLPLKSISPGPKLEQYEDSSSNRSAYGIKKVMAGAKYRIAPNADEIESPKIVYNTTKPADRMVTTFGAKKSTKWFKLPARSDCSRHFRALTKVCGQRSEESSRRQPNLTPLQITQV